MLVNLHVKNFAIIDEADIDFGKHLNILTGETGAGKSILVGSISIVLGARVSPEIIGQNGEFAMVEAVFQIEEEAVLRQIRELDIEPEDGQIVISRKITGSRSINKINGESVSVGVIRKLAALCMDIHGQHEHQSLLDKERHLAIVDEFGGEACAAQKAKVAGLYREYTRLKRELGSGMSEEERARQLSFLEYERDEIRNAHLQPAEMEDIEEEHRRAANAGLIVEALSEVYQLCDETAAAAVSRAIRRLGEIQNIDPALSGLMEELVQIEGLVGDLTRSISGFMSDFSFDEGELLKLEQRLDCIHLLKSKYGESYDDIMEHLKQVEQKLLWYSDFEASESERRDRIRKLEEELAEASAELTKIRERSACALEEKISQALHDLNFAHVDFAIPVSRKGEFTVAGCDDIEFRIATNPGEPRRGLAKVASGGELSRIMLAIKSVFADSDQIETLIFDEIDVGISGRTAQKVSEKMSLLGQRHQVICITHLAQIAAMADRHFVIEKQVATGRSSTVIRPLSREESEEELARLLGGVEITEKVRENAREMKAMADGLKSY